MRLLEFIFQSGWHYLGFVILLIMCWAAVSEIAGVIADAVRKNPKDETPSEVIRDYDEPEPEMTYKDYMNAVDKHEDSER